MYEKFYGLSEKPFNSTPDPKFLFLGEHHEEALAHLIYGVKERKGFIVLTGEVGAGKTTLIRTLLERLGDNVKTGLILNPKLKLENFLFTILDEFGLETEFHSKADFLNILNKFLIGCLNKNENVLLIIDESQNLSPSLLEEIRLLLNLETSKEKLLQIILAGQPELNKKFELFELRQLKQRISIRYHIPPLTKAETKEYIQERLKIAGVKGLSIFTDKAINEIYSHAKGIPRLINILCDNALLVGYATDQPVIGPGIVRECVKDLKLKGAQKSTNMETPWKLSQLLFRKRIWQVALILVFFLAFVIGEASRDTRSIVRKQTGNERVLKIPEQPDISGNVRKNIERPESTREKKEGAVAIPVDPIQKMPIKQKNSPGILRKEGAGTGYTITVSKSDTLTTIASKRYGWADKDILDFIHKANPDIKDLDRIQEGQTIVLPALGKK